MTDAPALRPLGVGDVVDRVFTIYRSRPLLLLGLAAIPYLILAIAAGALTVAFLPAFVALAPALRPGGGLPATEAIFGFAAFVLLIAVLAIVLFAVQSAALVDAVAARYLGRETTTRRSFGAGLRATPRLIGAGLLVFLGVALPPVLLVVAAAVTGEGLVIALGVVAALVLVMYLVASWMVVPVVATIEGTGPVATLARAWRLSGGSRWRVLGLLLLLVVLQVVISALFAFALIGLFFADAAVRFVAQQGLNLLASIAWAPVQWGTFTVLYYDMRVRKEAFDLQLAAEALPREP
ncbi:MAG: hypothetical protein ACRDF0_06355 [Candidatus Limnocylindria bacterium]